MTPAPEAWSEALPEKDRARFLADFVGAFRVSAELGRWATVAQTIREWRSTAAVHADPELVAQLSGPIDGDFGAVADPTEDFPETHRKRTE